LLLKVHCVAVQYRFISKH